MKEVIKINKNEFNLKVYNANCDKNIEVINNEKDLLVFKIGDEIVINFEDKKFIIIK